MGIAKTLLFLLIVVLDGAVVTYTYKRSMPPVLRLCVGACTGFALVGTIGFVAASLAGAVNAAVVWITTTVVTLPMVAVARAYRARIAAEVNESVTRMRNGISQPNWTAAVSIAFYVAIAILLGQIFGKAAFLRPDGIYTGVLNNLGDLPFHMQIVSSFSEGRNFPPEDPAFAGIRFSYPFLADFLAAMVKQSGGISLIAAMWLENMVLALAMVGLIHYWTLQLTRDRLAGLLAPVLVLFSGGLGWSLLFSDACGNASGIFGLLPHLPHRYTIGTDPLWRWGNSLTTLFVPQRSMLLGVPLAIVIFKLWWGALTEESRDAADRTAPAVPPMLAAGVMAGMLPFIHAHTFIVVMMVGACLVLLFPKWRAWAAFFLSVLVIAVPEMLWAMHGSGVRAQTFLGWFVGWDHGNTNAIYFWFLNTGAFIPLLLAAILWRREHKNLVQPAALRFYLPFVLCFVLPNLVKFAPWGWDNIKVLFYWYLASAPLVALLLASWFRRPGNFRLVAAALLLTLTLAGALDILRVLTGTEDNREFDTDGIAVARQIIERTEPRAVVLHAPTYDPPVFLTGRRSLLGYPGQAWSRGLDYGSRENDIRQIYAGSPQAPALISSYRINYVMVGPQERTTLAVNDAFWSRFPVIAQSGEYRVVKVDGYR
ncbi:MAG: hypothetical protein HYX72_09535 [Acidobacteria bacterium]|nr:hypothetical protein [Acidobacteriota bacterium]